MREALIAGQLKGLVELYRRTALEKSLPASEVPQAYYEGLLEYLAENGTEQSLPVLEDWVTAVTTVPRDVAGITGSLYYLMRCELTLVAKAWYVIRTRHATDVARARVMLEVLRPDAKIGVSLLLHEEYAKYLPLVRSEFYDILRDGGLTRDRFEGSPYHLVYAATHVGKILVATPALHPTPDEAREILANDQTFGQHVILCFLSEWEEGREDDIHSLLVRHLHEARGTVQKRLVLNQMRRLKTSWPDVTQAAIEVGREALAGPRTEDNGNVLFGVARALRVSDEQARLFLQEMTEQLADLPEGWDGLHAYAARHARERLDSWQRWKDKKTEED